MKNKITCLFLILTGLLLLPVSTFAQGIAADLHDLQGILGSLYNQMMPLCTGMIGIARAIAGFATLWFIGARVWKHLAAAEPIDYYPLLRPFAVGFCIAAFPAVLALVNGVLQPVVDATHQMAAGSNAAITTLLARQQQQETAGTAAAATPGSDPNQWYQYEHPDNTNSSQPGGNLISQYTGWSWQNMFKQWIADLLNVLFEAAALCIDTVRTFKLIVLAILGPLCFGLSIFDGFQHTLKQWIARYVNVFLWLPIANIFGAIMAKIQENMILLQASGDTTGNVFGNSSTAYLIFLIIGIVGYFTVPSIANYIMNVGGHALFGKTSALASMAVTYVAGTFVRSTQTSNFKKNADPPSGGNEGNNYMTNRLAGHTDQRQGPLTR